MAGAFCPICYDTVDVLSNNLESVSGCGHVFHAVCLQKWVDHSPVSPQCPLCKASCGSRQRQRLYFQTSGDSSQHQDSARFCSADTVYSEADLKHVLKLEEKVRLLKESLELSRQQNSQLQAGVEDSMMKVLTFSEMARQAHQKQKLAEDKLRRTEQDFLQSDSDMNVNMLDDVRTWRETELDGSQKEKQRLMKDMAKLERDIAATKLVENVDLSEDEVLNLTSAGAVRPQSKDDYIQILAKALVTRNWAFKNLMTTCNEHCLQKDSAKRESSKLRAKIEQLQARLKELTNACEKSENATLRSLSNLQTRGNIKSERPRNLSTRSIDGKTKMRETGVPVEPPTSRHMDQDELSREGVTEHSNRPGIHAERLEMDSDPSAEQTMDLSPCATETWTNKRNTRVCSPQNMPVSEGTKSIIREPTMDESISFDLTPLPIPIRREQKSSLVEESYFSADSLISWKETARNLVGSKNISGFNLSGPNGPSGRTCIKPPPSFIVPPSHKGSGTSRGKRTKLATSQGLKIDHFFGRH